MWNMFAFGKDVKPFSVFTFHAHKDVKNAFEFYPEFQCWKSKHDSLNTQHCLDRSYTCILLTGHSFDFSITRWAARSSIVTPSTMFLKRSSCVCPQ